MTTTKPLITLQHQELVTILQHGQVQLWREIKPQPVIEILSPEPSLPEPWAVGLRWKDDQNKITAYSKVSDLSQLWGLVLREYDLCPYGKTGDLLHVSAALELKIAGVGVGQCNGWAWVVEAERA